jgi:glycosyltransferase involved in cell wall biosynthesis
MGDLVKNWLARAFGRSGPPVIAVFLSGDAEISRQMAHRMRGVLPEHPHLIIGPRPVDREAYAYAQEVIELEASDPATAWLEVRRRLRGRWIALAPFVWSGGSALRWIPWLVAPRKLLAFNKAIERHHLRLTCPLASWRFLRGEAVGDIFRPTVFAPLRGRAQPEPGVQVFPGRPPGRRLQVAVVTPYFPFPLSHGGAVRIYNLLREAAADADISLFSFAEKETAREVEPLREFCTRITLVETPRWDPPALVRTLPNGVAKFQSRAMGALLAAERVPVVQVEYTQLAHLGPKAPGRTILVEHDVTFDLHRQLRQRATGWSKVTASLEAARWRRYEVGHAHGYDRVVAMSEDDLEGLASAGLARERLRVIENGVDLARFVPEPPPAGSGPEVLFIGSFRHFPNILGYRYLLDGVWPTLQRACPELKLTVVAGADHAYYWRRHMGADLAPPPPGVELLDFVADVRPLYVRATVVAAPLEVSAGTNLKVLEALAMERALVSTPVGVAGLGLTPGETALLADRPSDFAASVLSLLWNRAARDEMAAAGRALVEQRYGWDTLARKLVAVWEDLARPVS